jgi:hypothetical protein
MSSYRFFANEDIPVSALREIRSRVMSETLPRDRDILIVHDVTQLDYTRQNAKKDREQIGDHDGMGYEYIPSVAVDLESGVIIGVVHDTLVNEEGPDDRDVLDYDYEPLFAGLSEKDRKRLLKNHRHQMATRINTLAPLLAGHRVIHTADREFDDIFLLDRCVENGADFVIRSSGLRNVQVPAAAWIPAEAQTGPQAGHPAPEGWLYANLARLAAAVPVSPYKTLPLDSRNRVTEERTASRRAHLSIGAFPIRLYRIAKRNKAYFSPPRPVQVHVVVIREENPPEGTTPLCWMLMTSLPVDTPDQLARVGRSYERRWKIEEYFKLLKSGYRIEATKLDSARKTAKLLVVLSLSAMAILHLKHRLSLPAEGRMGKTDYLRIYTAMREPNNREISIDLRLYAYMVKLGGWIGRRNDPIGPTVLMRGFQQLMAVFDAMTNHPGLIEEAKNQDDLLRKLFAYNC